MNIQEVLDLLQNLTNSKITQTELGKALGKTRSDINSKIKRGTEIKLSDIRKIENYFDVKLIDTNIRQVIKSDLKSDEVIADYYEDAFGSCGSGAFVLSENKKPITIPKECFDRYSPFKAYSVINAIGDSMLPYIQDKDKLIVEHWQGEQIRDNGVYVFRLGDNIFVKRLVLNIDQLVIKSDNDIYPIRFIDVKDLADFQIIGQIVGLMRNMK